MSRFRDLSLTRQFLIASLPVLFVATLAIGWWVSHEIEQGVAGRLGEVTSLYVDSLVTPHIRTILDADPRDAPHRARLDTLLTDTALGQKIVAFNIWRPDGTIAYSTNAALVGRRFPTGAGFARALTDSVHSQIVDRADHDHGFETDDWPPRLIETYAPVHEQPLGKIVGVAELYQSTAELDRETATARWRVWLVVVAAMAAAYLMLLGLVRRGSRTIDTQRRELGERVAELSALLARNAALDARVRDAAARTTALNERFLRRISADLHDGPGQDLGFALMRVQAIADSRTRAVAGPADDDGLQDELAAVRTSLTSALGELRSISAGLQLPELESLSVQSVAERAIRDYERKAGSRVAFSCAGESGDVALPTKITVYRLLQESLANGLRHGAGLRQSVSVLQSPAEVVVEVVDRGPGFAPDRASTPEGLGLAGMRERVRALGGTFVLRSAPGSGTEIRAVLPTTVPEVNDE